MPYTAEVSRTNPTCFLFLIDQSRSMAEGFGLGEVKQQKASGVADTINRWLQELSLKCAKGEGISDYFHVGVIGYGESVGPAFVGQMAGRDLIPISEIARNPGRVETRKRKVPDERGNLTEQVLKVPIWFDPIAGGGTPMCRATDEAHRIVQGWLADHPGCYPPVIIHVTDGEATDGDPKQRMRGLTSLSSSDGNAMLFNIHLSSNPKATPIIFPDSADGLPDDYSRMLFETASLLTPNMRAIAKEHRIPTTNGSRAFVLNADMVLLVQAIDIGTRPNLVGLDRRTADHPDTGIAVDPVVDDRDFSSDDRPATRAPATRAPATAAPATAAPATRSPVVTAAPAATAPATTAPATTGPVTVTLTVLATGEMVEASIKTNKKGVVKVVPKAPLDPRKEYRLGPALR